MVLPSRVKVWIPSHNASLQQKCDKSVTLFRACRTGLFKKTGYGKKAACFSGNPSI
jgi:hypothetical protein